ncbi:MAG: TauD/TfdA family dioxygenase [Vulcanimicrobiaceae bacterium]
MLATSKIETALPLIIEAPDGVSLENWFEIHRERFDRSLAVHGAVLFRGFDLPTVRSFERAARAAWGDLYGDYGDLPRVQAGENIYGSTPYPADQMIRFHNESSHLSAWPMRISFHCVEAASAGGSTPLLDTRRLMHELDPGVVATFAEKGLLYVRNFPDGVEPTWQEFFQTTDRDRVAELCRIADTDLEWRDDGTPRIARRAAAVTRHRESGVPVFFNQIQLHHIACVDDDTREGLLALFDVEDLPRHVYYGDGSPIPDSVIDHLDETYERSCVRVPWQRGDMLVLDNMAVAHARDPFVGRRRIVVAMGKMATAEPS